MQESYPHEVRRLVVASVAEQIEAAARWLLRQLDEFEIDEESGDWCGGRPLPSTWHAIEELRAKLRSLTEDEFQLLSPMSPDQRGEWLKKNKERTALGRLADQLNATQNKRPLGYFERTPKL